MIGRKLNRNSDSISTFIHRAQSEASNGFWLNTNELASNFKVSEDELLQILLLNHRYTEEIHYRTVEDVILLSSDTAFRLIMGLKSDEAWKFQTILIRSTYEMSETRAEVTSISRKMVQLEHELAEVKLRLSESKRYIKQKTSDRRKQTAKMRAEFKAVTKKYDEMVAEYENFKCESIERHEQELMMFKRELEVLKKELREKNRMIYGALNIDYL